MKSFERFMAFLSIAPPQCRLWPLTQGQAVIIGYPPRAAQIGTPVKGPFTLLGEDHHQWNSGSSA
jgi:hypothetical protein